MTRAPRPWPPPPCRMKLFTLTPHWFRFGRTGPGLSWRPASEGLYFDERYGYVTTFTIFGWLFRCLPRYRDMSGGWPPLPRPLPPPPPAPPPQTNPNQRVRDFGRRDR